MRLSAEQIQSNWDILIQYIKEFPEPRREKLLGFYEKYKERMIMMPAAHKAEYHNCFPGGYVDHVLRVIGGAIELHTLWAKMGGSQETYTKEELIFSALNHDLGKIGDENYESYIPQTDQWRREKLGETYMFNDKLPFSSVPDRSLFLLQSHGITYTFNEMLAIQTHDGLYDEANKKYLQNYLVETKPRTNLPYIIHQADIMAARIEFEREWLPKFSLKKKLDSPPVIPKKEKPKDKALSSIKSQSLQDILKNI